MSAEQLVDKRYYQVARAGTVAERLVVAARNRIFNEFIRTAAPTPASSIVDVGVSDVVGEAANVLERKYPWPENITAVGLGTAIAFQAAFPSVRYQQVEPGQPLPFPDRAFDIATSNAVLEHVGSEGGQKTFVRELARVARFVFISVPHRFFPVEHHTGIPLLHWADAPFALACRALGKHEWTRPENLIFMTRKRLHGLAASLPPGRRIAVGSTGIPLGPFSSNLFMTISDR